ncbi:MAG: hypothetical protein ACREA7_01795 [Nitrosotalea sp.]
MRNRAKYYLGIAVAGAAFLFLVFREATNHSISVGAVGGVVAAGIFGGCIIIGFSSEKKEQEKISHG